MLDFGDSVPSFITKKTGIHRRNVYDVLDRLIEKGLVTYILHNNRHIYRAQSPYILQSNLEQKEKQLENILPELLLKHNSTKDKYETIFFRGKNGLKSVFDMQIEDKQMVYVIGGYSDFDNILKYYFNKYDSDRKKNKIFVRILFNHSTKRQEQKLSRIPLSEIRFLPKGFSGLASINIFGFKVAIILWTENPLAIVINQKEIAETYMNYFNYLWNNSTNNIKKLTQRNKIKNQNKTKKEIERKNAKNKKSRTQKNKHRDTKK